MDNFSIKTNYFTYFVKLATVGLQVFTLGMVKHSSNLTAGIKRAQILFEKALRSKIFETFLTM